MDDFPKTPVALKINAASYDTYLTLPVAPHLPLAMINDHFVVYDRELPNKPWGLFDSRDFHKFYTWEGTPVTRAMTRVRRITQD